MIAIDLGHTGFKIGGPLDHVGGGAVQTIGMDAADLSNGCAASRNVCCVTPAFGYRSVSPTPVSRALSFSRLPFVTALLLCGCTCAIDAAESQSDATPARTIVGYRNIWNLQGPARTQPQSFQIDAVVHYYDPVWRQLWAQEGNATLFLSPPPGQLPIKAGQLVRLTGVSTPDRFWAVQSLTTVVLDEHPAVTPLPAAGRLTDFQSLEERFVEIDGLVDSQRVVDANHARLLVVSEGVRIDAALWLEAGSTVPQYAGLPVRIRGVYHPHLDPERRLQSIELAVPGEACVSLLAAPAQVRMAAPTAAALGPGDPAGTIVGYENLWNLSGPARDQPQQFQIDAVVLHYDPHWRHLWGQEGSRTFFLVAPPGRLPIRAGQLVRLAGVTIPSSFSQVARLNATVLDLHPNLAPLSTTGRLADFATLNERLVEIEGLVESQGLADLNHLRCVLIAEGYRVELFVWLDTDTTAPALNGCNISVQGVYSGKLRPDGQLQSINLIVPGPERITIKGSFHNDSRFTTPTDPIESLPRAAPDSLLHVSGRVVALAPDTAVTLRDETGQLDVLTPQEHGLRLGDNAEAIGYPSVVGTQWLLRRSLVRAGGSAGAGHVQGPRRLLRLARQVLELPASAAAALEPVQLQGVVTWSSPDAKFLFLQDPSGGIRVEWTDAALQPPPPGGGLSVQGNSRMGEFAPAVQAMRFVSQYLMSPPEPRRLSLEEALSGLHEALWVQLGGLLRAVEPQANYSRLLITTATGEFEAFAPAGGPYAGWIGSFVAARGVCTGLANSQHQLTAIRLWVPGANDILLEEAAPADLFALPENSIASLRQYGLLQAFTHWFRTSGTIVYHVPGRPLIIQDGNDALTVSANNDQPFTLGERVDVVGIHGRDGPRLVLRQATIRRLGPGPVLQPVPLTPPFPLDADLDSRLVHLQGTLDEVTELDGETLLEIRHPNGALLAQLPGTARAVPTSWRQGSEVELTGIYHLRFDEHRRRIGFELLLRTPADLRVLRAPPWWTSRFARDITLLAAACVIAAALWVAALRRKVRQQTEQLRLQLDKETHLEAELERAQRVHSLGTLAGGIAHDFNNLLTVILGNISLTLLDQRVAALARDPLAEAQASAERARDLVQQMLTFAHGGDPIRESFALVPAVRETVALALSGSASRAEFAVPGNLPPVWADRTQIRRAVLNLLAHSVSALPAGGVVSLAFAEETVSGGNTGPLAPGRYVSVRIADHGEPIPAERLPSLFDPYAAAKDGIGGDRFGMATAYSIAQKHGGHLTVRSKAGAGTVFTLWLPAAVPHDPSTPDHEPAGRSARILFMEHEPDSRRLGERILRHLGHEPVAVADGAACLAAYRRGIDERQPFDLVILDLTVPGGMGGRETLAELRKIDPLVCAIASGGHTADPALARHREHGFAAIVPNPLELERLGRVVAAALDENALR
jgi:signal transduction histidine kinase